MDWIRLTLWAAVDSVMNLICSWTRHYGGCSERGITDQATQQYIAQDLNPLKHHCENFRSRTFMTIWVLQVSEVLGRVRY